MTRQENKPNLMDAFKYFTTRTKDSKEDRSTEEKYIRILLNANKSPFINISTILLNDKSLQLYQDDAAISCYICKRTLEEMIQLKTQADVYFIKGTILELLTFTNAQEKNALKLPKRLEASANNVKILHLNKFINHDGTLQKWWEPEAWENIKEVTIWKN